MPAAMDRVILTIGTLALMGGLLHLVQRLLSQCTKRKSHAPWKNVSEVVYYVSSVT